MSSPLPPVVAFHDHGSEHSGPMVDSVDTASIFPRYDGPLLLSEAGLYVDLPTQELVPGALPVSPRFPLWSDGSDKRRWLVVPEGEVVDTSDPDHWVFPVGTRAFKEFVVDGVRVETRMYEKREGDWSFTSFVWRADGSDADATPEGALDVLGTSHDVPSRADCAFCHVGPADLLLGLDAFQLDAEAQAALPLAAPVVGVVPGDEVTSAALGYLHGNCSSCHREGSLAGERSELLLDLRVGITDPQAMPAIRTGVGKRAHHPIEGTTVVVVPGDPSASQLWVRMGLRTRLAMPPRGTEVVDAEGMSTIEQWIDALGKGAAP